MVDPGYSDEPEPQSPVRTLSPWRGANLSSTSPLRLGIVGCGRILPAHLHGLKALAESGAAHIVVTALSARRREDAEMFRQRGVGPPPRPPVTDMAGDPLAAPHLYVSDFQPDPLPTIYTDYRDLLAADDVDAVLCLTSLDTHHTIALEAAKAGKHVLVEKPLAITIKAANRMVNLANTRGLVLATAENARYSERTRAVAWLVDEGYLGQIQLTLGGGIGAGDWSPNRIVAETAWRHDKLRAGGGPIIDLGVHRFNVIRYWLGDIDGVSGLVRTFERERVHRDSSGEIVQRVRATVEDTAFATLHFGSGTVGQFVVSWAGHGDQFHVPGGWSIWGSRGSYHDGRLHLDDGTRSDAVEVYRHDAPAAERERHMPHGLSDPIALEQYDFFQAIRRGGSTEVSGEEGLLDLAVAYAVIESSVEGRLLSLTEVEERQAERYQAEINRQLGI